jgi:hypothetical protein
LDFKAPEKLREAIHLLNRVEGRPRRYRNTTWARVHQMLDEQRHPPDLASMEDFCNRYNRGRKGEDDERLDVKKLKQIITDRRRK